MFSLGLLGAFMGLQPDPGVGPIKQTILRGKKIVVSTAHNGGLSFKSNGPKPAGKYETVLMRFSSQGDIDDRNFKSIKLLSTYRTKTAALKGHRHWLSNFK